MQSEAGHDRNSGNDAANNDMEFHFRGQCRGDICIVMAMHYDNSCFKNFPSASYPDTIQIGFICKAEIVGK